MKNVFQKKATELNNNRKNRKLWKKIFGPLAFAAVFCTTYALILPAITMEGEPVCGYEEHFHGEACYEQLVVEELVCGFEENEEIFHEHSENCFADDETPVCSEPEVSVHVHDESCFLSETKEILICEAEEHIHNEGCYASEETSETEYLCGMGIHSHIEDCFDGAGNLTCTIPEHAHEASCLNEEVDTASDTETEEDWKALFAGIEFTGNWSRDLVSAAKTQAGYSESETNVVLENEVFKGYTRYGEKYGDPYGDWSGMFVSFCAEYAGITGFPVVKNPEKWLFELDSEQDLRLAAEFVPETGDIVFIDTDADSETELLGIISGKISGTTQIEVIAGDTENGMVEYLIFDAAGSEILGYYELPENPMMTEEIDAASETAKMIANLPSAEEAKAKLDEFNRVFDKESFDNYILEHSQKIEEVRTAYDALNDAQKLIAGDISVLTELETVLTEAEWKEIAVLAEDKAVITKLDAVPLEKTTAGKGETVLFGFTAEMNPYTEEKFAEARVKLEFALALPSEKADFDLEAMTWLEEAEIRTEKRFIGEEEKELRILSGYKRIRAGNIDEFVVPGTFTESAAVKILDMSHGEKLSVTVSAAMEHGTWEGICETHGAEEKLTIRTEEIKVSDPIGEGEQKAEYEALHAEYEVLLEAEDSEARKKAADELWDRAAVKYLGGYISEEAFADLSGKLSAIINNGEVVGEEAEGYNWKLLKNSGWFEELSGYGVSHSSNEIPGGSATNSTAAFGTQKTLNAAGDDEPSDVQILEEGGSNTSSEGAVYVSKTIDGTDIENVFDITLEVITQDIVTEVYKEPDMAVVIVMDISNTMNSAFGSTTRYKAAMTAAENFIDQFQKNNKGASKIGFVAFNSDAHQIFAMSQCSTAAQAASLKTSMRNQTGNIINASGYASSKKRFTNIEAGLKLGWDMIKDLPNEHKYIVFLSDGFPTTYISSGYTGYDTYDTTASRFYDSVEKYGGKNRPTMYGVSYSNEAAIRARKMAASIKSSGGTIFSIGVDIGGQTIQKYVDQCAGLNYSVVDRRNTNYEIGSASDANAFKNWIGNSIGSGYYYDSTNSSGLNDAFDSIFTQIKELNAQSSHLDWVATDPMGDMGVHEMDSVEFIGFYDKAGNLVEGALKGESRDGAQYENTASFDEAAHTIHWDLKQSGYVSTVIGSTTNYRCTLTYRVRLQNELTEQFTERKSYDTNDLTSLTYRVIDQTGSKVTISERRNVEFPIPAVEGYLSELSFIKTNSIGDPLPGATFALTHDTENCGFCRGDGKGHVDVSVIEATSGSDGKVIFEKIPSGHCYTLTETVVPDGFKANDNKYTVKVSYDSITVTVIGKDGNEVPWDEFIKNEISYTLPATGGNGTKMIYTSGAAIFAAGTIMYGYSRRRRKNEIDG
ncbi:MAG: VWA domain-containing protein [Ruminococcaceae bacterium]|nr:VWA domain-containing protein [Oscillospiraceae bacterium]